MTTIKNLIIVFKESGNQKKLYIKIMITTIIQIIIGVILPLFWAKQIVAITDNIVKEVILASIMVLVISLVNETNRYIMAIYCRKFRMSTTTNLQMKLGKEILNITEKDIEKNGTGTFIERLNNDTDNMSEMYTIGVGYISRTIINIGIFITIFMINKIVFLYYLIASIILTLLYLLRAKKIGEKTIPLKKQRDVVSGLTGELVRGEKDLKILFSKESFLNRLDKEIIEKNKRDYNRRMTDVTYRYLIESLSSIFLFILVLLLVYVIKKDVLTISYAAALYTYRTNIFVNLMENISSLLEEAKNFNISTERVFSIIDEKNFTKEKFSTKHLDKIEGNFEFKNVSFSYDDIEVIKDMSFKINSGETVAIVGKSGAGKTTIFNLIGKIYDINKGTILIDNNDIKDLDEESIRNHITIISQNPYIFNMSIRDNFKLIKEDIKDEEILDSLKLSYLYDYVMSLPNKLDTIIGEGGTNLSGGQRQRLAIARALIQKTEIILFDEATSALDNETQRKIQDSINNLKGKYTVIIIAHRLSTIKNADRIMVLDKGKIIKEGKHKELLESSIEYKTLYNSEIEK